MGVAGPLEGRKDITMNFAPKHLIATGLLAALGVAAIAQTPPPATGAAPAPMAREHHGRFDPARMQERMAQRQAALKQQLQLTAAQEGAWTAFTSAMKPPAGMQRPDRAEFAKLTTPERIDRMRAMRAARSAEMDKRADATKTFYAALTAEQKKVFDAQSLHRGGHRGGHHGGGHHKG
jgi:Spy/CpxP family protein refolding chaperone